MPRRIYEYSDSELDGLQLHLHGRLVHDRAERGRDRGRRSSTRSRSGAIAGPDPWKANTLEWFTPSPPPENNFDVVPRVRSVEPMKDIRREIEQRTGSRAALPLRPTDAALGMAAPSQAALAVPGVKQVVADYFTLTKPKVQLLLLLTTITTMYVAGDPSLGAGRDHRPRRLPERGRRGRVQPLLRPRHRRRDGPHGTRPVPGGPDLAARGADLRVRAADRLVRAARVRREPAGRVPRARRVRLVHARLHGLAQAPLAAEHRHRRRRRRDPAARRLGGGDGLASPPPRCTCSRSSSTGRRRTSGRSAC